MSCPVCRSDEFFLKDPHDPYTTHPFDLRDGNMRFEMSSPEETPEVTSESEVFCNRCTWHGLFKVLTAGASSIR